MMSDLRRGVWAELYSRKSIDAYRRNLQRAYISQLGFLMSKGAEISDVKPVVRGELNRIKRDTKKAITTAPNTMTRYHLQDIVKRIDEILDPK